MKNYISIFLCIATMSCATMAIAQPTTVIASSISAEISMPETTIKVGAPIMLRATMTNLSGHDLQYVITTASPLFEITVTHLTGRLVPETDIGRRRHIWLPGHELKAGSIFSTRQILGPQKSVEVVQDICKEYDIRQPGQYSVRVEVQDPEHRENKVKSNIIVFTVVP